MNKSKGHSDGLKIRGFFRVQITEDGKGVVGDSGWKENQITNLGIRDFLVNWLLSGSGGEFVQFMGLGSGSAPASNATSLNGEIYHNSNNSASQSRIAVASSLIDSGTAQFVASFASQNSFVTASTTVANLGLFNASLTSLAHNGTLFAGNTFASSTCATNQSINATYQIRFASA